MPSEVHCLVLSVVKRTRTLVQPWCHILANMVADSCMRLLLLCSVLARELFDEDVGTYTLQSLLWHVGI